MIIRVKCQSCGHEFDCDTDKDPSCTCPKCFTPNPPSAITTSAGGTIQAPPVSTPQPSPTAKSIVVYAILKDGSKQEVTRVAEGVEVVLGRGELSRFSWRDPDTISRVHIKIKFEGDKIYVRDDGSTNGTYMDGSDIRGKGYIEVPPGKEVVLVNPSNPVVKLVFSTA